VVSELRPRGIGEILDSAVALYRARFTRLVKVAVIVVVPVQALSAIVLLSAQPDHYSLSVTGAVTPQYDSSSVAVQLAAFLVVAVVGVLSTALVIAVCTRILADAYIDTDSSAGDAFRAVRPRVFAVVGTSLIVLVSEALGVVACLVGVLVPLTLFAVAVPALILERVGVGAAIGRSIALTKTHLMHVLGLVLTAQLLSVILNTALAEGIRLVLHSDNGTVSAVIGQSIAGTIAGVLTTPFVAAAVVALYFDLRIRDEAYDIQLLMQRNDARASSV
jgi:flagellar biosynthesis protein FlhB